jgi:glycosyltransferase involved in cell wall biosynthesis
VLTNKKIIKLSYWIERSIYKKAVLINVLTPAFKDNLINSKGITKDKIILIPNAADFSLSEKIQGSFKIDDFREEHDLEGKFVITYVGAHGVANHLEQILFAANLLRDTSVLFLLIGQGMRKEELVKMRDKMELLNVRFIDSVPKSEVFKFILASDMGASVLKNVDTFKTVYSNKTFDYMSCKKPILMAIDGVSRTLVEEADAGSFVEPENPDEYNRIIRKYVSNPDLLTKQGLNGYNFAKKNFDRKILAKRYLNEIQNKIKENL